jgi:hypothetical protein
MMKRLNGFVFAFLLLVGTGLWISCDKEGDDDDDLANHNVGNDCLMCHKTNGGGDGVFTAGGTVWKTGTTIGATGAKVELFASPGATGTPVVTMTTQVGGNFYTKSSINFGTGLYAKVSTENGSSTMITPVTTGACNSCHGVTTGKITVQ